MHCSTGLLVAAGLLLSLMISGARTAPARSPRQAQDSHNCRHPFHAFLCKKTPRSRIQPAASYNVPSESLPAPTKTLPSAVRDPEVGEDSFLDPAFILTTTPSTTLEPTTPSLGIPVATSQVPFFVRPEPQAAVLSETRALPTQKKDICGHSFHSFLCQPGTRSRRPFIGKTAIKADASFQQPLLVKVATKPSFPPPPPPRPSPPVVEESLLLPTFFTMKPVTTPPPQPEYPDASADSPSFIKPNPTSPPILSSLPSTQRFTPPRTTLAPLIAAPQQVVLATVPPEHYKGQNNPCEHAFHSFLCQPSIGSRRRNYGRAFVKTASSNQQPAVKKLKTTTTQRPSEVPEYSLLLPVAIQPDPEPQVTTTKRPVTTTRGTPPPITRLPPLPPATRPPYPQASLVAAPSFDSLTGVFPPNFQPAGATVNTQAKGADSCKHSFHSFLCQPTRPRKVKLNFMQQPAPSSAEESLLLPEFISTERSTAPRQTAPPPTPPKRVVTTPGPPVEELPDSTFNDPQVLLPQSPPLPFSPALVPAATVDQNAVLPAQFVRGTPDVTNKACNHPFHSYLCHKSPRASRRPVGVN